MVNSLIIVICVKQTYKHYRMEEQKVEGTSGDLHLKGNVAKIRVRGAGNGESSNDRENNR